MRTTSAEIDRVRADLATMQRATDLEAPFGRELVYFWSAIATCCAMLGATLVLGTGRTTGVVLVILWLVGAALLLTSMVHLGRRVLDRAAHPAPWRELREIGLVKLVAAPLLGAFLFWQVRAGGDPRFILATLVFYASLFVLSYALTSWTRRWAFGLAVPGLAFGFAVPVVSLSSIPLAVAACGTAIGLLSAAIHGWQLRRVAPPE